MKKLPAIYFRLICVLLGPIVQDHTLKTVFVDKHNILIVYYIIYLFNTRLEEICPFYEKEKHIKAYSVLGLTLMREQLQLKLKKSLFTNIMIFLTLKMLSALDKITSFLLGSKIVWQNNAKCKCK